MKGKKGGMKTFLRKSELTMLIEEKRAAGAGRIWSREGNVSLMEQELRRVQLIVLAIEICLKKSYSKKKGGKEDGEKNLG